MKQPQTGFGVLVATVSKSINIPPTLLPPQLRQSLMNLLFSVSNYGSNTTTSPVPFRRRMMQQDMFDRETQARALAAAGNFAAELSQGGYSTRM